MRKPRKPGYISWLAWGYRGVIRCDAAWAAEWRNQRIWRKEGIYRPPVKVLTSTHRHKPLTKVRD